MFFKKYRRRFNNLCSLIYSNFTPIDTSSKNFVKVYDESNIEILLSHKDNDVDVEVPEFKKSEKSISLAFISSRPISTRNY